MFNDFIDELKRTEKEQRVKGKSAKATGDFEALLREQRLTPDDTWTRVRSNIAHDPRFSAVRSGQQARKLNKYGGQKREKSGGKDEESQFPWCVTFPCPHNTSPTQFSFCFFWALSPLFAFLPSPDAQIASEIEREDLFRVFMAKHVGQTPAAAPARSEEASLRLRAEEVGGFGKSKLPFS